MKEVSLFLKMVLTMTAVFPVVGYRGVGGDPTVRRDPRAGVNVHSIVVHLVFPGQLRPPLSAEVLGL